MKSETTRDTADRADAGCRMGRDSMLVRRRSSVAMLQFIVSRAHARGSHAMLPAANTRRVSRSGSNQFVGGVELCRDDRRTDSSLIGNAPATGDRHVART